MKKVLVVHNKPESMAEGIDGLVDAGYEVEVVNGSETTTEDVVSRWQEGNFSILTTDNQTVITAVREVSPECTVLPLLSF